MIFGKLLLYYLIVFNVINILITISYKQFNNHNINTDNNIIKIVLEGKHIFPLFQGRAKSGTVTWDSLVAEYVWSHLHVTRFTKKLPWIVHKSTVIG